MATVLYCADGFTTWHKARHIFDEDFARSSDDQDSLRTELRAQLPEQFPIIENVFDHFGAPHYIEFAKIPFLVQINLMKFTGDAHVPVSRPKAGRGQHIDTTYRPTARLA